MSVLPHFFTLILVLSQILQSANPILLFPRNAILQLTYGFDTLIKYNDRIVAWGLGVQTTFFFPTNLSLLHIQTYEVRSNDDSNADISRELLYKYFIKMFESSGLSGEDCLFRAICEAAHTPFHVEKANGLLEKIAHYIFTPSESYGESKRIIHGCWNQSADDFRENLLFAEEMGRRQGNCQNIFSSCWVSIIDVISKVMRI